MFIRVDKKPLLDALLPALCAVSNKSTIAALSCVFLHADEENSTLTITGFDINKGLKTSIPATVLEGGNLLLEGHKFVSIVRSLPDTEVSVQNDDRFITTISCQKSRFEISGMSSESYPSLPELKGDRGFKISQGTLKKMISQVIFSYSLSDNKPVLTGINFEFGNGRLRLCSCDGYRVSIKDESFEAESIREGSFIVPGKTLTELYKLLSSDDESEVKVELSRKHIIFSFDNLIFFSRLIEGNYFDYDKSIPKVFKTYATVNLSDAIAAVERSALIIDERAKSPIKFIVTPDSVRITCNTVNGRIDEEFDAEVEGEEITVGFNHRYLLDALKGAEISGDEKVLIELYSPISGMIIKPVDHEDFCYMVLPVRLN
ncbi:MAG: DNA polymerase III subunit beta [Firmicutes bacterium]|nr:DNA polymerase III subunit beta [Bacillota bacterium]